MKNNIKLLIADDSKVMRDAITKMFSYRSNIQVVAEASNLAHVFCTPFSIEINNTENNSLTLRLMES
jgi:hypothetical protein